MAVLLLFAAICDGIESLDDQGIENDPAGAAFRNYPERRSEEVECGK
jgi:hypothetical protein